MPPGLKNGISFPHVPTLRPLPMPPCEYNNGYFNANATLGYRINF